MRIFGLIGYPLSHSFSAKYFAKKFETENIIDSEFRLFPIEDVSQLSELVQKTPELTGLNVTIPYKVSIVPLLSHISDEAKDIGAVNCVLIKTQGSHTELLGYNTDVYGFRLSLEPLLQPFHKRALILGTGGAAKAVSYSLQQLGIDFTLVSRIKSNDSRLQYSDLTEKIIKDNLLIINTTPCGMFPNEDKYPDIPYQFLSERHFLFDLTYNPAETQFLMKGKAYGTTTKNGLQMLEIQAEKSWEIWNSK